MILFQSDCSNEQSHYYNKQSDCYNKQTKNDLINVVMETWWLLDYPDYGAYWLSAYETDDIEQQLEKVWQEMLPLYQQLHAYARRQVPTTSNSLVFCCFFYNLFVLFSSF